MARSLAAAISASLGGFAARLCATWVFSVGLTTAPAVRLIIAVVRRMVLRRNFMVVYGRDEKQVDTDLRKDGILLFMSVCEEKKREGHFESRGRFESSKFQNARRIKIWINGLYRSRSFECRGISATIPQALAES